MTRKSGFTLIELLVVIAIIAILAAIIFPVFMRAKESSYRAGDMSSMNAIRNALQLYRADQEAYPPAILGYASYYASGPQMGQLMPATTLRAALYPKRIDSIRTLQPAYDHNGPSDLVKGEWPGADPRTIGSAPQKDLNGDGSIDGSDDIAQARQAYGPGQFFCLWGGPGGGDPLHPTCACHMTGTAADGADFYKISGYDVGEVKQAPVGSPNRWEIHYTLKWTNYAVNGGNRQDDPRQLIYSEPPDDTVITWDSWFREYNANNLPIRAKKDFVLFLGGGARAYDSVDASERSWRLLP